MSTPIIARRTLGRASTLWTLACLAAGGCERHVPPMPAPPAGGGDTSVTIPTISTTIGGKVFDLEIAADEATQEKGLGGRESIDEHGGMVFVFPDEQWRSFVMRDCPIPMDILFLDGSAKVVSFCTMEPEAARGAHERASEPGEDAAYNARLKSYLSEGPAQFVVELRAGTLASQGIARGDTISMDVERLRNLVK